jgi:cyclopropane fatty-acyl-phospholipid synthase-like methyltransferase
VEKIENIGGHYSKTLRLWKEQFLANFDSKIRLALKKEHEGMTDEEIEVFKRKWEVSSAVRNSAEMMLTMASITSRIVRRVF